MINKEEIIEINEEIKTTISDFEKRVIEYNQNLNFAGVWLFLATLGCWSVTGSVVLERLAVVFTLCLFFHQIITNLPMFKFFRTDLKEIEQKINKSALPQDSKDARLFKLEQVKKKHLSWTSKVLKKMPAYYLSTIFICCSMLHWLGFIP